ncbi:hypothetical protein ACFOWM_07630 [Ferruginibacter yonginensis]|uniref:Uncharacterized protein n=1 Tax=Ferruginibacter yonginensis TaxID=1310416 RepID=A0ABV8QSU8_9BACT
MKKIIILSLIVTSQLMAHAQTSGDPKVDALIAQLKDQNNSKGTVTFSGKGATVTDAASIIKNQNGVYDVGSSLVKSNSPSQIHLLVKKITNGKQTIIKDKNNSSIALINGTAYELAGDITFTVKGKTVNASFKGTLYEIDKKKAKAADTPSGTITATFKNITIPNM